MNPQDKHPDDWQSLRQKIIGLGEKSIRKSYYPELRQRLTDFENFYTLMNHVSDTILLFDVDTLRITDTNRAACTLLQYDPEEMRTLTLSRICPEILNTEPQETPSVAHFISRGQKTIPVELTAQVIRKEETTQGVIIARDIRERLKAEARLKKSEKRYRRFFNEDLSGAYVTRPDGVILACNPAFAEMMGFESVEEAMQHNMVSFYSDPSFRQKFLELLRREKKLRHHLATLVGKDGRTLHLIGNVTGVFTETGELIEIRGYLMDLTEQKRLESQLQQSSKMEAIGTLAGGIAHDFNNILMAIQGGVSLLSLDTDPDHPHHELLKQIEKQVEKAARLTAQLLGFARKGRYETQLVNLNPLVAESIEIISRTRKNITLSTALETELPTIEADRSQVEQVVMNLCINAADAMPDGGQLILKTRSSVEADFSHALFSASPGRYVVLTVADTGEGMTEETLQRIFEPFYTTKSMGKGTGLGLASVYGIVKSHAGTLAVDSQKDAGSTFTIYFPASDKKMETAPENPQPLARGIGNILLVDDEEIIRDIASQMLERLGYGVRLASSGAEAVRMYREEEKDIRLVLLDLIMPGMSGSETFDAIRAVNPSARILLCSGYSSDDQAPEILSKGCAGFIQKPFGLGELSQKLKDILG
jgi:two-component system, cell cycle sensor histidine kinase and response regulator CckA